MAQITKKLWVLINAKDNASAKMRKLANTAALAGTAIASAFAVKSVKAAIDFQKSMQNVATLIDTNVESMEEMGDAVKKVARGTSVPLEELTSSLYDIRSAGIDAGSAMDVLATAADLGVAGLGTAKEATDILTSSINSFGYESKDTNKVANILLKTVNAGKTTIAELAQSFGLVAPIASTAGISLEELSAATAALTTTGGKASVAQTQLKTAILAIQAPTDKLKELFKKAGIESGQLALENDGLVETMNKIVKAADGDADALKKAMGSSEALSATLALTGNQAESFSGAMEDMEDKSDALKVAVDKQNETFDKQWGLLKNQLKTAMIDVGDVVLPRLTKSVEFLTEKFNGATESFKNGRFEIEKTDGALASFAMSTTNVALDIGAGAKGMLSSMQLVAYGILQSIGIMASKAFDILTGSINNTIGVINSLIRLINKIPRINIPTIGTIGTKGVRQSLGKASGRVSKFATGGIINEPISGIGLNTGKSYLMGEAGKEAIIPLGMASALEGLGVNMRHKSVEWQLKENLAFVSALKKTGLSSEAAAKNVQGLINSFMSPSSGMVETLKKLEYETRSAGGATGQFAMEEEGLTGIMSQVVSAVRETSDSELEYRNNLKKILGSQSAYNAVIAMTDTAMQEQYATNETMIQTNLALAGVNLNLDDSMSGMLATVEELTGKFRLVKDVMNNYVIRPIDELVTGKVENTIDDEIRRNLLNKQGGTLEELERKKDWGEKNAWNGKFIKKAKKDTGKWLEWLNYGRFGAVKNTKDSIVVNMQGAHFYGNEKNLARKIGAELMSQINLNIKPAF